MKNKVLKKKNIAEGVSTRLISDSDIKRPVYKLIYLFIVLILVGLCMMK